VRGLEGPLLGLFFRRGGALWTLTELFTGTLTSSAVAMHFESAKKVQVFPGACEGTGSYFFHQTLMAAPS
jgi:hypothetical protein